MSSKLIKYFIWEIISSQIHYRDKSQQYLKIVFIQFIQYTVCDVSCKIFLLY